MSTGGMLTFNTHFAHVEALVHGLRAGFLSDVDYKHLAQYIKMNLQETDYYPYVSDEQTLNPQIIKEKSLKKLVEEFTYLRSQACDPLDKFMDYITYEYMIDNVVMLLKATLNNTQVDVNELIEHCHPLGLFKESTMRSIVAFDNTAKGFSDLYQTVLIDTPVGKYFAQYLYDYTHNNISGGGNGGGKGSKQMEVKAVFEETSFTIIESYIMKLYLEDFHRFCMDLGGETAEVMSELLKVRADQLSINMTLASFNTPLASAAMRSTRRSLYPSFGFLYPEGITVLSNCEDVDSFSEVLKPFKQYSDIWERSMGNEGLSIDDSFYLKEARLLENAFMGQMQYAVFYAFVKLKEQEMRNLVWISECIIQRRKDNIGKYIPIFSRSSPWRNGQIEY